jgi:hypothetical protein
VLILVFPCFPCIAVILDFPSSTVCLYSDCSIFLLLHCIPRHHDYCSVVIIYCFLILWYSSILPPLPVQSCWYCDILHRISWSPCGGIFLSQNVKFPGFDMRGEVNPPGWLQGWIVSSPPPLPPTTFSTSPG